MPNADFLTQLNVGTLLEHAMGNVRAMMIFGDELLTNAAERKLRLLDENLFFETKKSEIKKKRQGKYKSGLCPPLYYRHLN